MTTSLTHRPASRRRGGLIGLAAGVVLLAGLAAPSAGAVAAPAAGSAATAAAAPACTGAAQRDYQKPVKKIRSILSAVAASSKAGKSTAAAKKLRTVVPLVPTANKSASAQIGRPPTDPESDDPPGPTAVAAALNVDHRIVALAVPLFAKVSAGPSRALAKALVLTAACRLPVARKVAGLPPEGAGADYGDSMADTLPTFKQEVGAIAAALAGDQLAAPGRSGLTRAQPIVKTTQKVMDKAFGGGERP